MQTSAKPQNQISKVLLNPRKLVPTKINESIQYWIVSLFMNLFSYYKNLNEYI